MSDRGCPADPQVEFNMGTPAGQALDDAVDAAVRSTSAPGAEAPSAETIAAVRARAAAMLGGMTDEDREGLKALQSLSLSIGLPAARATFQSMIRAAKLRGAAKTDALRAVAELSPITEVGCMKVDFFNRASGAPDVAYLVLDTCPRGHDLGAQLDKLKAHVSGEKWPEVTRSLSMLIHIGRSVYGQMSRNHLDLIRRIRGAAADDPCTEYLDLRVDPENTTLYLVQDWPDRVGIYVRLNVDVQAELARAAAK